MFTNAGVLDSPTCALTCLSLSSLCSLCSLSDSCVRVLACFAYFCVFLRAGQALSTYATGYSEYAAFESMLARESQGNTCCDGWVCETNNLNVSGQNAICSQQSQQDGVDIFLDDSDGGIPTHSSPPPPSPPSPPPSPPPPPPPPPLPMVREVRFVVSVAGDISSFNSTKFEENVAIAAGVSLSCVELNITAASIKVTAIIRPEYNSSVTAEDVQENLEIAFNSSTTTASDVLGVTVEEISTAPEIYNNDSPPTPPSFPPDEEGSGWLTVALLLVFLSACCAFCAVLRKLSRAKNVSSGDSIPLIQRAKKRAKKRDVPPFRGERP